MMLLSEWEAELKCSATGKPGELFRTLRRRSLKRSRSRLPVSPFLVTNVQAVAATTYDGVDHILGLASEAVTDGIKALGTLQDGLRCGVSAR